MGTRGTSWLAGLVLCGCGRIGFDAAGDAGGIGDLGPFDPPVAIAVLGDPADDDDPCISADGRELYFASKRGGAQAIWAAVRDSSADPWSPPVRVAELSEVESKGPGLTADALTIYLSRNNDIYRATRVSRTAPWSLPMVVPELVSGGEEGTPMPFDGDLGIVFRSAGDLFVATRPSPDSPFGVPRPIAELNTNAVESAPHIAGSRLYFTLDGAASTDLVVATADDTGRYGPPRPLAELNSSSGDSDPSLTGDERVIVFASRRTGNFELYEARR